MKQLCLCKDWTTRKADGCPPSRRCFSEGAAFSKSCWGCSQNAAMSCTCSVVCNWIYWKWLQRYTKLIWQAVIAFLVLILNLSLIWIHTVWTHGTSFISALSEGTIFAQHRLMCLWSVIRFVGKRQKETLRTKLGKRMSEYEGTQGRKQSIHWPDKSKKWRKEGRAERK